MQIRNFLDQLQQQIDRQFSVAVRALNETNPEIGRNLEKSGYSVFYTDPRETLKEGDLIFMGLNPRTDNLLDGQSKQTFDEIPKGYCAYTNADEEWDNESHRKKIGDTLQHVLDGLGSSAPVQSILATNLYFFKSKD